MFSRFSIGNLGLVSTFCGISALAMMVNYKKSEKEKYARQPFCREPVKLLRNHQGANHVLGCPITLGVRILPIGLTKVFLTDLLFFSKLRAKLFTM